MTSEFKTASVFGSEIQTKTGGQSRHSLKTLQRGVLFESFADCGRAFSADIVAIKAAKTETWESWRQN